jgi:Lipocalin-like domain
MPPAFLAGGADQTLNMKVEASSFPNWTGQDQKRTFTLSGDDLNLVNPAASVGAGFATIVLKRTTTVVAN